MTDKEVKFLVIHPFGVMADVIRFFIESEYNALITTCHSVIEAQDLLKKEEYNIIIAATSAAKDKDYPFYVQLTEKEQPPSLIIIEHQKIKPTAAYNDLNIKSYIEEENLLEELNELLTSMLFIDSSKPPEDWTRISIWPLMHFEELPEDVFIKLITGRMLKLFSKGDNLTPQDVERYTNKGVNNLYLQRQAFLWLIKQLDKVLPTLEEGKLIKVESSGVTEEPTPVENYVVDIPLPIEETFVKEVHEKSKQVLNEMRKNKDLAKLLKLLDVDRDPKSYFKNRIQLVCTISCALAKELSWSSDAMFEKFIYVAHMHDLSLISHPRLFRLEHNWQIEVLPNITEDEKKLFLEHPNYVAELVSKDSKAPPEAESMIRQHHERANGKGFPEGLPSARIMPTAALMQLSINLAQYILENPKWDFKTYIEKNGPLFKGGPFTKILKALETVCKGKI